MEEKNWVLMQWVEVHQVGRLTSKKNQDIWKNNINGCVRVRNEYGECFYDSKFVIGYQYK